MPPSPITFIYTNSYDLSADHLIARIGIERVFRFNLDLWRDYVVSIDARGFQITNAAGRRAASGDVAKFLWRKPLTNHQLRPDRPLPQDQVYAEEELAYAMREMWNLFYHHGRAVLIDPVSDVIGGKLVQCDVAKAYFRIPDWQVVSGLAYRAPAGRDVIVKSMTSVRTGEKSVLFASRIGDETLSPETPWLVQDYVNGEADVTVLVVRDRLFGFELDRKDFPQGVADWKQARLATNAQVWKTHALPASLGQAIAAFMGDMSLHYARLDFVTKDGEYYFLEANPNGEWGWLDEPTGGAILNKLVEELSPATPCHPLPNPRTIRIRK